MKGTSHLVAVGVMADTGTQSNLWREVELKYATLNTDDLKAANINERDNRCTWWC